MNHKRSALLVEDDANFCMIFSRLLDPWNLEIVVAGSAAAAIEMVSKRPFDYYQIDLQLGDGNSITVLSLLESRGEETIARCVVVTSFGLLAPGFTDFPIVDKSQLSDLGFHLRRILGEPEPLGPGVT